MTIDSQPQQDYTPSYAAPQPYAPSYAPPQPEVYANYSNPGMEQQPTYQATIIRTKKAGGGGLVTIGMLLWIFSFFFLYDSGLFWTFQAISVALCCVGSVIAYSGRRQYRTYVISHVSV